MDGVSHPASGFECREILRRRRLGKHTTAFLESLGRPVGKDDRETTPSDRFTGVIRRAYEKTGRRVVVLVDEYNKPLLQALENAELQEAYRAILKAFYGVLKTMDGYIRLAFLTGVTKFGKVSVFSDLNNLDDISMREPYAAICGITEAELLTYFDGDIHKLASSLELTYDETRSLLKKRYDGYHFVANVPGIYNPFSLLNTFKYMRPEDYWFETGTPSYLVELLKHTHYDLYELANTETDADVLNSIDSTSSNLSLSFTKAATLRSRIMILALVSIN